MKLANDKKYSHGFTLIELLVVIAIIGLLSSVVLSSLNTARMGSRDARRINDLRQIKLALELYFDDNRSYPVVSGWVFSTSGGDWIPGLVPTHIPKLPVDPKNNAASPWTTGSYSYSYGWNVGAGACPGYPSGNCSGQTYDLIAQLENTSDSNRCQVKCWRIHTFDAKDPWCAGCGTGSNGYSPYLYADH